MQSSHNYLPVENAYDLDVRKTASATNVPILRIADRRANVCVVEEAIGVFTGT